MYSNNYLFSIRFIPENSDKIPFRLTNRDVNLVILRILELEPKNVKDMELLDLPYGMLKRKSTVMNMIR